MKQKWLVISALIVIYSNYSAEAQCGRGKRPYDPPRQAKAYEERRTTKSSEYADYYERKGSKTVRYDLTESSINIGFNRRTGMLTETRSETSISMSRDSVSVYKRSESRTDKVSRGYNVMNMVSYDPEGNLQVTIRKQ